MIDPDCSKAMLQVVICGKVELESSIFSDGWRGYTEPIDVGYGKHLRVDHGKDEFAKGRKHINGIEGFGACKNAFGSFSWYGTEHRQCESRFNHRGQDLGRLILQILRNRPLNE